MDHNLQSYIEDVTKYILPMATLKEQVVALAQYVSVNEETLCKKEPTKMAVSIE